jgi:hypothetical protein
MINPVKWFNSLPPERQFSYLLKMDIGTIILILMLLYFFMQGVELQKSVNIELQNLSYCQQMLRPVGFQPQNLSVSGIASAGPSNSTGYKS